MSPVCCIYHKPKAFDESSSEESGSDSDCDSGDDGGARPANGQHHHQHRHHGDGDEHHGQAVRDGDGGVVVHELGSDDSNVNRYERQPKKPQKGKAPQRG